MTDIDPTEALARVGREAAALVTAGARVGLGTGRAAEAFIRALGARVRTEGLGVVGVATSERSAALAAEVGIATEPLSPEVGLDLAFDGADEVAPDLSLTKGLGGAMLRERVVAADARRFIVLVTPEKLVARLGERSPLPIEVAPFALPAVERALRLHGLPRLRVSKDGAPYRTDNGNAVVDLHAEGGAWSDARALDRAVRAIPGVVDTGFFFDLAERVLVSELEGVRVLGA
jgi:ribose 5-phosphate isomerase A